MHLKTSEWKKVPYSVIYAFVVFAHAKKKIKKMKSPTMENVLNAIVPTNRFRCVCVYLHEPVCGDIKFVYILTL